MLSSSATIPAATTYSGTKLACLWITTTEGELMEPGIFNIMQTPAQKQAEIDNPAEAIEYWKQQYLAQRRENRRLEAIIASGEQRLGHFRRVLNEALTKDTRIDEENARLRRQSLGE